MRVDQLEAKPIRSHTVEMGTGTGDLCTTHQGHTQSISCTEPWGRKKALVASQN